jgi:hypothetical protein
MKILFTALHFANYRNFESVIRVLAARGHDVHLLADERETFGGQAFVERLAAEYPNVSFGLTPSPVEERSFDLAQKLRFALDYVRFLDPRYAAAEKLRLRNIERTPRIIKWMDVGHRRRGDRSPQDRGVAQIDRAATAAEPSNHEGCSRPGARTWCS